MDDLANRVAVITGGGSGIGAELGRSFAREGAKIVLADLDEAAMASVVAEIEAAGGEAIAVRTDVGSLDDVRALDARAVERFGAVHVVCNNAGIGVFGPLAKASHADWVWTTNVNYWGVVHGVEVFLPRVLAQGAGGYFVNTASMAGLAGMAGLGVYCASKFAVVGLTEALHRELKGTGVGASVLCPMVVDTRINDAERNRPADLRNEAPTPDVSESVTYGRVIGVEDVGRRVRQAMRDGDLYVLTHREQAEILRRRAERLAEAAEKYATA